MVVVPVVDLRGGQAVRAVAGQRNHYQPLATSLCQDPDPLAVVDAYRQLHPFPVFYLADLDAIEKTGDNFAVAERLAARWPECWWWLDAGFENYNTLQRLGAGSTTRPVIGSESQSSFDGYQQLLSQAQAHRPLLSLDFKNGRFLGPEELLETPSAWPPEVILMQLDRVGVGGGPDTGAPKHPDVRFYAAGGVRDSDDLQRLQSRGYAGVLVASALHDGTIGKQDIAAFSG